MSQRKTSPNYWGYNLQQIFEGDAQNPKKGTFTIIYQPLQQFPLARPVVVNTLQDDDCDDDGDED